MPNNEKHWLDGILELDNDHELASNNDESDDLSWLTAQNEETPNFLEGIELLEVSMVNHRKQFIESFKQQNIMEIIKKQANKIQLTQPEMKILKAFKETFPDISIEELEEVANAIK
ncbi:hypothetical protein ABFV99_02315 [Cytobacillus horneckiae]|uniref:hypothetical protein n=1 Tax=Cytobacillus horneckiae TaxID=549687 RepID=UPI0034CF5F72